MTFFARNNPPSESSGFICEASSILSLAEHNNVVKALPSDRTDQPFGISVLPWGAGRSRPVTNAHRSKSSDEDLTIGPIPVRDQGAGSLCPTACSRDLITDPS